MFHEGFYLLAHGAMPGELVVNLVGTPTSDDILLATGQLVPLVPVRFEYHMGKKLNDFLLSSSPVISIISDRFLEIIRPFSGWKTYPVDIVGRDGKSIGGFHGLAITGRSGPIDNSRSTEELVPPQYPAVRPVRMRVGLFFDESTWDGSDIVVPHQSGHIFVTNKLRSALVAAGLKNVELTQAAQIKRHIV